MWDLEVLWFYSQTVSRCVDVYIKKFFKNTINQCLEKVMILPRHTGWKK